MMNLFNPLIVFALVSSCTTLPASEPRVVQKKWELVWSDEFDKPGRPDTKNWKYQTGDGGWGNHEAQNYTNRAENARVEDGILVIEARKEKYKNNAYTSARLNSKTAWTFGRFEVRAKLPSGRGTWPAIWMMPMNDGRYNKGAWPDNGEIDIMEHVGFEAGVVHASLHTKSYNWIMNTQKTAKTTVPKATSGFRVYALEWSDDEISMFIDKQKFHSFKNPRTSYEEWPFHQPFYLILNIAVGGNWGGKEGIDDSVFPQKLEIDYVRVYRAVAPAR